MNSSASGCWPHLGEALAHGSPSRGYNLKQQMKSQTIYFVAGEASADNHGAALMRSLRESGVDLTFVGRGGPQMRTIAGAQFKNWIDDAAVLGLWEVIKKYG